jgi:ADP-L-glycero-D-manno-heptose 6-epimerase
VIIVTGGAGFIGSCIVAKLNAEGVRDIVIVDNLGSDLKWKNLIQRRYREYFHKRDFLEQLRTNKLPAGVKAIIHMGACSSTVEKNADYMMENNYRYTKMLAEWALEHDVRFIYASSGATYGNGERGYSDDHRALPSLKPLNIYGYSKHAFDLWALENDLLDRIVGLKFFNVYGPNERHKGFMTSFVIKAFQQIQENGLVKLFKSNDPRYRDGESVRDFVYVKDCVDIIWWLLNQPKVGGILNIGSGKARSWKDLATATFHALDKTPQIEFTEMPESVRNQYQYFTEADIQKLRSFGYTKPLTSLEDGVKEYVQKSLMTSEGYLS